ncbi:phosphate acetyltransferase [bacterium]|nr:phosphate acetyltransferase [bacterium]
MNLIEEIRNKAKSDRKRIVLPESQDIRVIQAASILEKEKIADPILLGKRENIIKAAKHAGINIENVKVIDPEQKVTDEDIELFYDMRKHKGISKEDACTLIKQPLLYAALMVRKDMADGSVAGAVNTTANTLRAAIWLIGPANGIKVVSSCFVMIVPDCVYGEHGVFIYADAGIVPNPTSEELASIAIASAKTARMFIKSEPKVAMLSFSTKGSASHELIDKVIKATELAKKMCPDLQIDGELQADAAIVPEIAKRKSSQSNVAGKANVLIFPNLEAGNISYKLTQYLAKAQALGPLLQGLQKPAHDLSRGCSVADIVNISAIAAIQAHSA